MRFFQDLNGNSRPVSAIVKIGAAREVTFKPTNRKGNVFPVELVDGHCEITEFDRDRIMETPVHMVPAVPGTFLLAPLGEAGEEDDAPWQTPVVAWAYTAEGFMVPYTAEGANDGLSHSAPILYPNGMVVEVCGSSWRKYEDYLSSKRAERDEKAD